jgi:hypothetical protein
MEFTLIENLKSKCEWIKFRKLIPHTHYFAEKNIACSG